MKRRRDRIFVFSLDSCLLETIPFSFLLVELFLCLYILVVIYVSIYSAALLSPPILQARVIKSRAERTTSRSLAAKSHQSNATRRDTGATRKTRSS